MVQYFPDSNVPLSYQQKKVKSKEQNINKIRTLSPHLHQCVFHLMTDLYLTTFTYLGFFTAYKWYMRSSSGKLCYMFCKQCSRTLICWRKNNFKMSSDFFSFLFCKKKFSYCHISDNNHVKSNISKHWMIRDWLLFTNLLTYEPFSVGVCTQSENPIVKM